MNLILHQEETNHAMETCLQIPSILPAMEIAIPTPTTAPELVCFPEVTLRIQRLKGRARHCMNKAAPSTQPGCWDDSEIHFPKTYFISKTIHP